VVGGYRVLRRAIPDLLPVLYLVTADLLGLDKGQDVACT